MERNRKLVWQCCFLVAGLSFPALAAAQTAQLQAGNVSITVNRTDGSYVIGIKGQAASVLHSQVAAQIDRRWVRSNEYPRHEIRTEAFSDQLGPGHLLTITHTGEAAQPDLVCIVRAYSQRPERDQIDSRHEFGEECGQEFPVPAEQVNQHGCDRNVEHV